MNQIKIETYSFTVISVSVMVRTNNRNCALTASILR